MAEEVIRRNHRVLADENTKKGGDPKLAVAHAALSIDERLERLAEGVEALVAEVALVRNQLADAEEAFLNFFGRRRR